MRKGLRISQIFLFFVKVVFDKNTITHLIEKLSYKVKVLAQIAHRFASVFRLRESEGMGAKQAQETVSWILCPVSSHSALPCIYQEWPKRTWNNNTKLETL
jgi:hypothetical protein